MTTTPATMSPLLAPPPHQIPKNNRNKAERWADRSDGNTAQNPYRLSPYKTPKPIKRRDFPVGERTELSQNPITQVADDEMWVTDPEDPFFTDVNNILYHLV
jgi:hypothetical protein